MAYIDTKETSAKGVELRGLGCGIKSISVNPHRIVRGAEQMRIKLDNGYELSILVGNVQGIYTAGGTFEVATCVIDGGITDVLGDGYDGVYGYQTHKQVSDILRKVSYLKSPHSVLKA